MLGLSLLPGTALNLSNLFCQPWVIVDLETTGGHIGRDRITEIGLVLGDGERVERYSTLVNPGQSIPPFIVNMTGISDEMVAHAPPFAALAPALFERLSGRLLLAHNARFDYGFLKNEFRRAGLRFQVESLCTVKLSRRLYPQHFKHSLDSLIERHGLTMPERHRALADAEALYQFLGIAGRELGEEALRQAQAAMRAAPAELAGLPEKLREKLDELPDLPGIYTLYGAAGEALYVGRAVNLYQRVRHHFSGGKAHGKEVRIDEAIADVEWQETIGEFGATLAAMERIRRLQPRHNPRGRAGGEPCSLQLQHGADGFIRPRVVLASELDFSRTADLYGLFRHVREARKALADLARAHGLCLSVLDVETVTSKKGQPCAAYPGRCRGACVGREEPDLHNIRLLGALSRLKVKPWPFDGRIAVREIDEVTGDKVEHVFDRWCYLGSRHGAAQTLAGEPAFDLDCYKLLEGWLRKPAEGTELVAVEG